MELQYTLDNIEKKQDNGAAEQLENARQLQLSRTRLLYSRFYNQNSIRVGSLPIEYIVLLNYLYNQEIIESAKDELASLNHIIANDIQRHKITEIKLNNI